MEVWFVKDKKIKVVTIPYYDVDLKPYLKKLAGNSLIFITNHKDGTTLAHICKKLETYYQKNSFPENEIYLAPPSINFSKLVEVYEKRFSTQHCIKYLGRLTNAQRKILK